MEIIVAILTLIDNRFMQLNNSLRQFGVGSADEEVIERFSVERRVDIMSWNDVGALLAQLHTQGIDLLNDPKFAAIKLVQDFRDRYRFVATQHQVTSTRVDDPEPRVLKHAVSRGHSRKGSHNYVN